MGTDRQDRQRQINGEIDERKREGVKKRKSERKKEYNQNGGGGADRDRDKETDTIREGVKDRK